MAIAYRVALAPSNQYSSRLGVNVDRFQVHHMAGYWAGGLATLTGTDRTVSSTWAIGGGEIVLNVPLDMRPFVSADAAWDRRSESAEVANSFAGGDWPVADVDFDNLARVIADWSERRDVAITDDTVITHQELYRRFGASYATACPGSLQARKPELLDLARKYRNAEPIRPATNGEPMYIFHQLDNGQLFLVTGSGYAYIDNIPSLNIWRNRFQLPEVSGYFGDFVKAMGTLNKASGKATIASIEADVKKLMEQHEKNPARADLVAAAGA